MSKHRGLFVKLPALEAIDVIAASGLDFAVVDLEHSQLAESDALRLVRHASALGLRALVRIPTVDRGVVNRLLEAGAAGLQLSTVCTAAQVRALRDAMRHAPQGTRSISLTQPAAGYGVVALGDYLAARADRPPLLVAQLETMRTDDPLAEILTAGVDVAFIGSLDLLVDAELDTARRDGRIEEIAAAATHAGVTLGAFGLDDDRISYDVVGSDVALLRGAVAAAGRA
jgi:4-hydroxy-2-oxoheptanedioate aldolase